jgi:hypothetical protein
VLKSSFFGKTLERVSKREKKGSFANTIEKAIFYLLKAISTSFPHRPSTEP